MNELTEIPRANSIDEYPYADNYPCWVFVTDTLGRTVRPYLICKCGDFTGINKHHIHKDGTVTASYYHPEKINNIPNGCGWHVFLKLKDWVGLEFLPDQDYPLK